MRVEIWSDIACPWCYIGKRRFENALAEFPHRDDVEVSWKSYQLDPSLPEHYDGTELEYLAQRKGMPEAQVEQMFGHVIAQAAGEGLHYDYDALVVANSFRAHQLIHLAAGHSLAGAAKEALLSAHFEHGRDIGSVDVLAEIGTSIGLDEAEARSALAEETYADAVRTDIAEASSLGVQGVPFFVFDRKYGVSGAQPAAAFTEVLNTVWKEAHPLIMAGDASADGPACGPDGCATE